MTNSKRHGTNYTPDGTCPMCYKRETVLCKIGCGGEASVCRNRECMRYTAVENLISWQVKGV